MGYIATRTPYQPGLKWNAAKMMTLNGVELAAGDPLPDDHGISEPRLAKMHAARMIDAATGKFITDEGKPLEPRQREKTPGEIAKEAAKAERDRKKAEKEAAKAAKAAVTATDQPPASDATGEQEEGQTVTNGGDGVPRAEEGDPWQTATLVSAGFGKWNIVSAAGNVLVARVPKPEAEARLEAEKA